MTDGDNAVGAGPGALSEATVVELARRFARGLRPEEPADMLSPLAVLALAGDGNSADRFERTLFGMADEQWGIADVGFYDSNCAAFIVKNIAECYRPLRAKGLVPPPACSSIERWLHRFAEIRVTGEIQHLATFASWNLRNQENTTGCLAETAAILLLSACGDEPAERAKPPQRSRAYRLGGLLHSLIP